MLYSSLLGGFDRLVEDPRNRHEARARCSPIQSMERPHCHADWAFIYDCSLDGGRSKLVRRKMREMSGRATELAGVPRLPQLTSLDWLLIAGGAFRGRFDNPFHVVII